MDGQRAAQPWSTRNRPPVPGKVRNQWSSSKPDADKAQPSSSFLEAHTRSGTLERSKLVWSRQPLGTRQKLAQSATGSSSDFHGRMWEISHVGTYNYTLVNALELAEATDRRTSSIISALNFVLDFRYVVTQTSSMIYRVAQKSKLLTQYNSLLFLSHPVLLTAFWVVRGTMTKLGQYV